MKILGIDPGATTGWCVYDTEARRVLAAGQFRGEEVTDELHRARSNADRVVLERPVAHGPTRPQVVDCAWIAGRLAERLCAETLTRREVKLALTAATQRDVVVTDDATAWAALVLLHGEGSDAKPTMRKGVEVASGGALGRVTAHERAAVALAVAWELLNERAAAN